MQLRSGLCYFNIHTTDFPAGIIRGQINQVNTDPATLVDGVWMSDCAPNGNNGFEMSCTAFTGGLGFFTSATFSDSACATRALLATNQEGFVLGLAQAAAYPAYQTVDNFVTRSNRQVWGLAADQTLITAACPSGVLTAGRVNTVTPENCPQLFTPNFGNLRPLSSTSLNVTDTDDGSGMMPPYLTGWGYSTFKNMVRKQAGATSCPNYVSQYFGAAAGVYPAFMLVAALVAALLF